MAYAMDESECYLTIYGTLISLEWSLSDDDQTNNFRSTYMHNALMRRTIWRPELKEDLTILL